MKLKGKTVLITGGAVRVGRAIALELAEAGADIFCQYHSSSGPAKQLKEEIERKGQKCYLCQSDLTKIDEITKTIDAAIATAGHIDILINNSALFYRTPLAEVTTDDWDTFHDLNLKAAFFMAQKASQYMLKQKSGKIINIGDSAAEAPFPAFLPYSISKAGIIAMTKGLAKALAPDIQVNCVNPGPVMIPDNYSSKEKQFAIDQTLLKREGSGADIARTILFLIEGSDYITGAVIPVDGGRHIR